MAYQVTYLEVLKALFIPVDIVLYTVVIGTAIVVIAPFFWQRKRGTTERKQMWGVLILTLIIIVGAFLGTSAPIAGAGWQLSDSQLNIKAPPARATLDLAQTKGALMEYSGPWRPVRRTNGFGVPGLATGWHRLANGEKAAVFRHQEPDQMLLLESGGQFYVLAHPGVEELYRNLVLRGVEEGDF